MSMTAGFLAYKDGNVENKIYFCIFSVFRILPVQHLGFNLGKPIWWLPINFQIEKVFLCVMGNRPIAIARGVLAAGGIHDMLLNLSRYDFAILREPRQAFRGDKRVVELV